MNSFSEQQIVAAKDVIESFRRLMYFWVILLAQMQSGKTETFLLVACELIRFRLVENVVIFSGNAETDLRDQLKAQIAVGSQFSEKYQKYLLDAELAKLQIEMQGKDFLQIVNEIQRVSSNVRDEVRTILSRIDVKWGSELDSYSGPTTKTLFIWEEAHHAQSKTQRPDKFLHKIEVSADGNAECLQRNNNLMMTISATPFSEISDNLRKDQGKHLVKMQPGNGYVGVKQIRDSGRIRAFRGKETGIAEALNLPKRNKKWYGIIRVSQKNEDMVKLAVDLYGWKWVVYDSVSTCKAERAHGEETWKNMQREPAENTVIIIRGKCRMGKNLDKKHLLFVFETSKKSKTDTVLQSLLGRVCGYSAGSDSVVVFLSEKIVRSGEIDRYIKMWEQDGIQIMPTIANNLSDKKVKLHVPIIPIRVSIDRTKYPTNDRSHLLSCLRDSFTTLEGIVNTNAPSAFEEVRTKVINNESKYLNAHYADARKEHQLKRLREVSNAHEHGIARDFGAGGGIDSDAKEIKYWIPKSNVTGVDLNVMYVTAHVSREDSGDYYIPATTGKEVFAYSLEDGSDNCGNGGMTIRLSSHTAYDDAAMSSELCNMIEISLKTEGCEKKIASCWDDAEKEFKGILVTPQIYKKLQKGGSIYKYVREQYQLELHTCKSSGRVPKALEEKGFIKLASISW